jgi:hypothetical protein
MATGLASVPYLGAANHVDGLLSSTTALKLNKNAPHDSVNGSSQHGVPSFGLVAWVVSRIRTRTSQSRPLHLGASESACLT